MSEPKEPKSKPADSPALAPPRLKVIVKAGRSPGNEYYFEESFRIGRDKESQVQIREPVVSRFHAEVFHYQGEWWLRDLQSGNGTFVDGNRIEQTILTENTTVELGKGGPLLSLTIEPLRVDAHISSILTPLPIPGEENPGISRTWSGEDTQAAPNASLPLSDNEHVQTTAKPPSASSPEDIHTATYYMNRYFSKSDEENIGIDTLMVRRAFERVQKKQRWRYSKIIAFVVLLLFIAAGYATYQHLQSKKMRQIAEDIFYTMKSLELKLANIEMAVESMADARIVEQINQYKAEHDEMEKSYDRFIDRLDIYSNSMSEEDLAILHITRIFGECEVNVPPEFMGEVKAYINKWRATNRLKRSIDQAVNNRYNTRIVELLSVYGLPTQFFYLALQESNFDINAFGPKTRYGIAKGMWQFIPATAVQYGLRTGPLVDEDITDPADERHDFEKSTAAASRFLRDIYNTEAQASGLLVMASYNWGQGNVRNLIKKMPENPRERNFWAFLRQFRSQIPKETYDYIFFIVSAAVIGENPRLFGFELNNPLVDPYKPARKRSRTK